MVNTMNLDEQLHVWPSKTAIVRSFASKIEQESELLNVEPLSDEILTDGLHEVIEPKCERAAQDWMTLEQQVLDGFVRWFDCRHLGQS